MEFVEMSFSKTGRKIVVTTEFHPVQKRICKNVVKSSKKYRRENNENRL